MKIGVDLSVLQTPHRERGIGHTAIHFINNMSKADRAAHSFVFYIEQNDSYDPLELLNLSDLEYEIRKFRRAEKISWSLPGKAKLLNSIANQFIEQKSLYFGEKQLFDTSGIDRFIQFDQNRPAPRGVLSYQITYDLIPYILETDYLWDYGTARANGRGIISALRCAYARKYYVRKQKLIARRFHKLLAISEHTKEDFIKHVGVPSSKIVVCRLGVDSSPAKTNEKTPDFYEWQPTSWEYIQKPVELKDKKFLLFVGGADPRREIIELVAAYNNLRARGEDVTLVLAGDTMKGPKAIPVPRLHKYLLHDSYLDQIHFLGFAPDNVREWLYKNAHALVYPSLYEGFGLPILEAMRYGTPVLTYKNSSIAEIAEDAAIYIRDFHDIIDNYEKLSNKELRNNMRQKGIRQAAKFPWGKSISRILTAVCS